MWHSLLEWLRQNEWLPLWIEGIALVAIFFWDRKKDRSDHEEAMAQIKIAEQQSTLLLNTERAWLSANITWAGTIHTHPNHFNGTAAGGQPSETDIATAKRLGKYVYVVSKSGMQYAGPHGETGVAFTVPSFTK
jgi:hypothetical protein